jgi:hypothetical protein
MFAPPSPANFALAAAALVACLLLFTRPRVVFGAAARISFLFALLVLAAAVCAYVAYQLFATPSPPSFSSSSRDGADADAGADSRAGAVQP